MLNPHESVSVISALTHKAVDAGEQIGFLRAVALASLAMDHASMYALHGEPRSLFAALGHASELVHSGAHAADVRTILWRGYALGERLRHVQIVVVGLGGLGGVEVLA